MPEVRKRVIVVGAGIVGTCVAEALQRRGHIVTLIERSGVGEGCSAGNGGMISISGCVPLGRMATLANFPQYFFNPNGSVSIGGLHFLKNLPWFARFLRVAAPKTVERIAGNLARLLRESQSALFDLADRAGCNDLLRRSGSLYVYQSQRAFRNAQEGFRLRRQFGIEMEELTGAELRRLEPALAPIFDCAVRIPGNAYCRDPFLLVKAIHAEYSRLQGRTMAGDVGRIAPSGSGVRAYLEDGHSIEADCVVVAAGVWTRELLRGLGVRLLLDAHRGYNVSTTDRAVGLTHPLIWEEQGFGITPMQGGLRAAGTVEIVGLSTPPNPRRPEQIRRLLSKAVSDVDLTGCKTWMGSRPMTPDTLPIIGAIAGHPNIYAATGHGHLGLSMAAVTGRIVADLVSAGRSEIDIAALSPNRFSH